MAIEPLLNADDVCRRIGVTRPTLRKLMSRGLRFMRIGPRGDLRYKREWVEDFIERTGTAADPALKGRRRRA